MILTITHIRPGNAAGPLPDEWCFSAKNIPPFRETSREAAERRVEKLSVRHPGLIVVWDESHFSMAPDYGLPAAEKIAREYFESLTFPKEKTP